jgi:hypothetical protein
MMTPMEKPLLNDPENYPDEKVLETVLKTSYTAYQTLLKQITGESYGFINQWRYYRDGGAWLCKVVHKKKTVFWLSVWDGFFKTTFYFTEKNGAGIATLDVKQELKDKFEQHRLIGKLKPLTIFIHSEDQLNDLLVLAEYKMKIK